MNECYNIVVAVKVSDQRLAIELSFSAGLGQEKPNSGRDRGETFFPNSGSDLDSDENFQIDHLQYIYSVCGTGTGDCCCLNECYNTVVAVKEATAVV